LDLGSNKFKEKRSSERRRSYISWSGCSGATPFTAVNVPAGSFTAFETLTEATVLGWIQAVVNADQGYADHISERVATQIDEVATTDAAMPWAPEDSVTPTVLPGDAP
jgi:hypothetical protein